MGGNGVNLVNPEPDRGSEQKTTAGELPEYLKQKLKARGILKDNEVRGYPVKDENVMHLLY